MLSEEPSPFSVFVILSGAKDLLFLSGLLRGLCLSGGLCINLLRRPYRPSKLNFLSGGFCDYVFECRQYTHRVQIIVVANVGNAEKLSLQVRISVGHDRAKLFAEEFANGR